MSCNYCRKKNSFFLSLKGGRLGSNGYGNGWLFKVIKSECSDNDE
jgi:hypothetical protein